MGKAGDDPRRSNDCVNTWPAAARSLRVSNSLRDLRDKARDRQRRMLGLPLVIIGVGGFYLLSEEATRGHAENTTSS